MKLLSAAAAMLVGLVTLAVFLPATRNGFVNWNDDQNIVNNANIRGFDQDHLRWMWTNLKMTGYVPITWMSLGVDHSLWKTDPAGFHLTSVVLHAANAAIFFFLALAILGRAFANGPPRSGAALLCAAAFAALIFSLHPLRVESVAWISQRGDTLCGFFYLSALLVYFHAALQGPKTALAPRAYLLCLTLFVMAVLSNAMGATLPLVLVILDIYPLRRFGESGSWIGRDSRVIWLEKLPFFAIALTIAVVALYSGIERHAVEPVSALAWPARTAITAYGIAFYLLKTVVPTGLSPLYPLTRYKTLLFAMPFQLSAMAVLLVTLTFLALRRRYRGLLPAWIASVVLLLPVGGIIHHGVQIAADRYTYLACLSWALLAGAAFLACWRMLAESSTWKQSTAAFIAILIPLFLAGLTHKQIGVWRDSDTLWTRAIAVEPSFTAHVNLAASYFREGDSLGAVDHYREAIKMRPDIAMVHENLGRALLDLSRWREAAQEFRLAIQLSPTPAALNGLGSTLLIEGDVDDAINQFGEALALKPNDPETRANLDQALAAKALREQGRKQAASGENP